MPFLGNSTKWELVRNTCSGMRDIKHHDHLTTLIEAHPKDRKDNYDVTEGVQRPKSLSYITVILHRYHMMQVHRC
jgi:hypothetical protein